MIQKILEYDFKGFHLVLAEDGQNGWKVIIGEQVVLFPTSQAAEKAINEILKDSVAAIKNNNGTVIDKVMKSEVTKTVAVEKLY